MPGGSGDYLAKGKFVFDWITKQNDIGNFYPIWGTCLGFENLAIYTGGQLENIQVFNQSLPIQLTVEPKNSKMYRNF